MPPFKPFAGARHRAIRGSSAPKTPEPFAEGICQPPSPPRPRFRLRKRQVSQVSSLMGPTQQFLASVASADVPIPSIEEPRVMDEDMIDMSYTTNPGHTEESDCSRAYGKAFSPPKTPAPGLYPSLSVHDFPDWSMTSTERDLESGEGDMSRPSTARSTQTESSLFSSLSFASLASSQHVSPEMESLERFAGLLPIADYDRTIRPGAKLVHPSTRSRRAAWTPAMSQHVWATYMIYLQDPTVTPFRAGKSGIPPEGVCIRVARVAMRTWRGAKPSSLDHNEMRSSSATPTRETLGPAMPWPHTHAATRAHLRELCKANRGAASRNRHHLAHTPTPVGRPTRRSRARHSTPLRSPSIFSPSDMVMSLALSTSDSMQPQGPLAELGRSQPTIMEQMPLPAFETSAAPITTELLQPRPHISRERLGSPFMAQSYGPSSSKPLTASLDDPFADRQAQSVGPRRGLRSPLPVSRTAPSSAKRRVRSALLESRRSKRPSLAVDLWDEPEAQAEVPALPLFPTAPALTASESLSVPRTNLQELFESTQPSTAGQTALSVPATRSRLGSPFSAASSLTVPSRSSNFSFGAMRRRHFATVQQPNTATTETTTPVRSSLASRLAYIDERLKDLRRRDHTRRSQSPL